MADTAAIDRLIDAILAGDGVDAAIREAFPGNLSRSMGCLAAYQGDVNAAIALVGDLLPGWRWEIWERGKHRAPEGAYGGVVDGDVLKFCFAPIPARALLLATLKAWKEPPA